MLQGAASALHDRQVAALRVAHEEIDPLELAADEARDYFGQGDHRNHGVLRFPVRRVLQGRPG